MFLLSTFEKINISVSTFLDHYKNVLVLQETRSENVQAKEKLAHFL